MRTVLLALAILACAAPAQARSLRLVDDGPVAGPSYGVVAATDGRYVVRVVDAARIVALDATTGTRTTLARPPQCDFTAAGAGSALFACASAGRASGRLVDLGTGAVVPLPDVPEQGLEQVEYDGVGSRWLSILYSGNHYYGHEFLNRASGVLRPAPRAPDRVVDLDAPGLYRRLCRPVVRPSVLDSEDPSPVPTLVMRAGVAAISTFTAADPDGRVVLERCGRRPRVIDRRGSYQQPLLVGGEVAWIAGRALRMRSLATGRVRALRISRLAQLVGVAHGRIYLVEHRRLKHVIV